jgi:transmembrane sensor
MENDSKYRDFLVGNFLCDEYFQDWVMHPDAEKNRFWQEWLLKNPDKEAVIALARETLSNLDFKINRPSPEKVSASLEKTWAIIDRLEASNSSTASEYIEADQPAGQKPAVVRWLTRLGIAASILLIIGVGWKLLVNNKPRTTVAGKTAPATDSLLSLVRHEVNTTGKEKRIQLQDGSLIVLANNSAITYHDPFTNTRDITLTGKAFFKVAKDKTKPFTVTSGAISTTAVGTEFTVTASATAHQIIVRLYEGKVVVKAVDSTNKRMKKDVFLLPGQQLIYGDATVTVSSFKWKGAAPEQTMKEEQATDNPSIPGKSEQPYFMFNNQSLGKVLNDLAVLYNVEILYNKQDVQHIYFTGKYNKSEPLEAILNRIGLINNLTITRKDSAYVISR